MRWVLPGGAILGESNREDNERTVACRPLATVQERTILHEGGVRTVKSGRFKVQYSTHKEEQIKGISIPLKNYKQRDVHSCGFVAALTVLHYFDSGVPARDVLAVVRPGINHGVDRYRLIGALERLGMYVDYRET